MGPWDPAVIGPIAGAVIVASITAGVAAVMIFRPLTKQLGELLEQMRRDRRDRPAMAETARVAELMETLLDRMERLEARQDFAERVIEGAGWKDEAAAAAKGYVGSERQRRTGES